MRGHPFPKTEEKRDAVQICKCLRNQEPKYCDDTCPVENSSSNTNMLNWYGLSHEQRRNQCRKGELGIAQYPHTKLPQSRGPWDEGKNAYPFRNCIIPSPVCLRCPKVRGQSPHVP